MFKQSTEWDIMGDLPYPLVQDFSQCFCQFSGSGGGPLDWKRSCHLVVARWTLWRTGLKKGSARESEIWNCCCHHVQVTSVQSCEGSMNKVRQGENTGPDTAAACDFFHWKQLTWQTTTDHCRSVDNWTQSRITVTDNECTDFATCWSRCWKQLGHWMPDAGETVAALHSHDAELERLQSRFEALKCLGSFRSIVHGTQHNIFHL